MLIPFKELRRLPFNTLRVIAAAVAKEIDNGDADKRHVLEEVFRAISS